MRATVVVYEEQKTLESTLLMARAVYGERQVVFIGFKIGLKDELNFRAEISDMLILLEENRLFQNQEATFALVLSPHDFKYNKGIHHF